MAKKESRRNEGIRAPQLRVIDENGNQLGILSRDEALRRARDADLDLVEVAPNSVPPVARIIDWGKYNYQKTKQEQKSKKKAKASEMKQIRFGLKIGQHDMDIKMKKVRQFLDEGHKVKISAFFRGRELAHKEIGYERLDKVVESLQDIAVVDQPPQMMGKHLSITVRKLTSAKAQNPQRDSQASETDGQRQAAAEPRVQEP